MWLMSLLYLRLDMLIYIKFVMSGNEFIVDYPERKKLA